ncbi:MAG: HAMP domain-containing protein [Synergistaceae bacterium]|jgi:two-component system sensor histidine kinase CpxA|nr:HAMP domain-containing protein [Synergistaceae bacterium]
MKNIARSSFFWKIYLTLISVLFLPIILFNITHIIQSREFDEFSGPRGIAQSLGWIASLLAESSESIPDERMPSWLADISGESGLDLMAGRGGTLFFSPGSEWLNSRLSEGDEFQRGRLLVKSSDSFSGRTVLTAALHPFGERNDDRPRRRLPAQFILTVLICVGLSLMLMRSFVTPLSELENVAMRLADGDLSVRAGLRVTGRSDEISSLGKNFNIMAERVEDLIDSQKRLLSDVSHEIRSPLQRMGVASAILRRGTSAEAERYIDHIDVEIERINEMVEELLELTRTAMPVTRSEQVDVGCIIHSIVKDTEFLCESVNKKIGTDLQELYVTGDSALLKRALGNVIHNAVRHAPRDSTVEISARREGVRAIISISDRGNGVPENELEKIFLPYYRTDKAREMSQGGVGLGLAIAKRIIERHDGVISASNAPSGGLVVTVCLETE